MRVCVVVWFSKRAVHLFDCVNAGRRRATASRMCVHYLIGRANELVMLIKAAQRVARLSGVQCCEGSAEIGLDFVCIFANRWLFSQIVWSSAVLRCVSDFNANTHKQCACVPSSATVGGDTNMWGAHVYWINIARVCVRASAPATT